jgi:hypothetical protein
MSVPLHRNATKSELTFPNLRPLELLVLDPQLVFPLPLDHQRLFFLCPAFGFHGRVGEERPDARRVRKQTISVAESLTAYL